MCQRVVCRTQAASLLRNHVQTERQFFFENNLAEVVRSKPGRRIKGKTPHTPPFEPFWAYSRTLPQGVELFCPINASPNEVLVRTPPDPPT